MSDTRKNPIQNGRPQPPPPPGARRPDAAATRQPDRPASATSEPLPLPPPPRTPRASTSPGIGSSAGMFAKHTPLMPDDPKWERRATAGAAAPRAEGSQVAPLGKQSTPFGRQAAGGERQASPMQGEGDRVAAGRYSAAAEQHVAAGKVEPAARAAKNSLDGAFAERMAEAEKIGRRPAELGLSERALGLVRTVRHRLDKIWNGSGGSRR